MKTKSAKAKGRRLQNWVRECILRKWTGFKEEDVRCALMGESGADVKLSEHALEYFPHSIECKNQEGFGKVYKSFDQAKAHMKPGDDLKGITPMLIIKSNNKPALVIQLFEDFLW